MKSILFMTIIISLYCIYQTKGVALALPTAEVEESSVKEMSYKVEAIPNTYAEIAKGPHWDAETQNLYYTDIYGPALYRYDNKDNSVHKCSFENEKISTVIIPIENEPNKFGVAMGRKLNVVEWDGISSKCKVVSTLFEVETDHPDNRFNDCKADPKGRFVGGTTHQENDIFALRQSNLFRWQSGQEPVVIKNDVGVSNGLTWNMNTNKFYYIDSVDFEIKEYDFDVETGDIKNPKVLTDFRVDGKPPKFVPDSMAIDTNGFLYIALFGDNKVVKVNPTTGKVEMDIDIPAELITSCTFGGPNMDILFVTTAGRGNKPAPAGQTFKVTGLGAVGVPTYKLKI